MGKLFEKKTCTKNWTAKTADHPTYYYLACLTLIFVLLIPSISISQSKDGFFLGVGATQVRIGGDFDGATFVEGVSVEVLPDLDTVRGFKLIGGFRADPVILEFSFSQSKHDGTWQGKDLPSTFSSYNIDVKFRIYKKSMIIPLVAFGFGIKALAVEGGSAITRSTIGAGQQDATFLGVDFRFGGGISISLHEHIAIDLLGIFRRGGYTRVFGIKDGDIEDVNGNGSTVSLEVGYIF